MSQDPTPTDEIAALRRELAEIRHEMVDDATKLLGRRPASELRARASARQERRERIRNRLRELGEKV